MSRLFAINSPGPQHGKTTLAELLRDVAIDAGLNVFMVSFADPLRRMIRALLEDCGYSAREIQEIMLGTRKQESLPCLGGKSYRDAVTALGGDWGRGMIYQELWVDIAIDKVRRAFERGVDIVLIDDLRHRNEATAIDEFGAIKVRVSDPRKPHTDSKHESETNLKGFIFDQYIENGGSLDQLRTKALTLLALYPEELLSKGA